jgi:hypothetical protein
MASFSIVIWPNQSSCHFSKATSQAALAVKGNWIHTLDSLASGGNPTIISAERESEGSPPCTSEICNRQCIGCSGGSLAWNDNRQSHQKASQWGERQLIHQTDHFDQAIRCQKLTRG